MDPNSHSPRNSIPPIGRRKTSEDDAASAIAAERDDRDLALDLVDLGLREVDVGARRGRGRRPSSRAIWRLRLGGGGSRPAARGAPAARARAARRRVVGRSGSSGRPPRRGGQSSGDRG